MGAIKRRGALVLVALFVLAQSAWSQPAAKATVQPAARALAPPPDGNVKRGQLLFLQCAACHSSVADAQGKIGPPLAGIWQRRAATVDGVAYSKFMAGAGLTWDAATLDGFLTNPSAAVPGTKMMFGGMPSARDRADLIAYLVRL